MTHRFALLPLLLLAACSSDSAERSSTGSNSEDTGTGSGVAEGSSDTGSDIGSNDDTGAVEDTGTSEDATADTDTGAGSGEGSAADNCPDELFVQPAPAPENSAYPDPRLRAYCDADYLHVESNGIIGYQFVPMTPNALSAMNYNWRLPLAPTYAEEAVTIPLLGVVAVAINGIPIYGANEAATPDNYGDPVYNAIVDFCKGHTGFGGSYHYHALVQECLAQAALEGVPSPIIGYALDGFPIYGPNGCLDAACTQVATFQSGWSPNGDPSTLAWEHYAYTASSDPTVLDQCNGRIGPDGKYAYYATDTFPYTVGCYHGVPGPSVVNTGGGGEPITPGGGGTGTGGGTGGGTGTGPTACTTQTDCDAAGACPSDLGCECATTPNGQACIPTCTVAADCPAAPGGVTFNCSPAGLCVPAR